MYLPTLGGGDLSKAAISSGSSPCLDRIFSAIEILIRTSATQMTLGAVPVLLGTEGPYKPVLTVLEEPVGRCRERDSHVVGHERGRAGAVPGRAARRGAERGRRWRGGSGPGAARGAGLVRLPARRRGQRDHRPRLAQGTG